MTQLRRDGNDTPFSAWLRAHPELDSHTQGLATTDCDMILHRFKTNIDVMGSRNVQLMMLVEVKTWNKEPTESQRETLYYHHQLLEGQRKLCRIGKPRITARHFGVYVLKLTYASPAEDNCHKWGRITSQGIKWRDCDSERLVQLLKLDWDPDLWQPMRLRLRRHHHKETLIRTTNTPLGFPTETLMTIQT